MPRFTYPRVRRSRGSGPARPAARRLGPRSSPPLSSPSSSSADGSLVRPASPLFAVISFTLAVGLSPSPPPFLTLNPFLSFFFSSLFYIIIYSPLPPSSFISLPCSPGLFSRRRSATNKFDDAASGAVCNGAEIYTFKFFLILNVTEVASVAVRVAW